MRDLKQTKAFMNEKQLKTRDIIIEKMKSGFYKFERNKCLCGKNEYDLITTNDMHGIPVKFVLCKCCGTIYLKDRLTQESYGDFYENHYRDLYIGRAKDKEEYFEARVDHGERIVEFLKDSGIDINFEIKNVLEVGCGSGANLEAISREFPDINLLGIDFESEYFNFGKEKGLNLKAISIEELSLKSNMKYDLIIFSHSLEHCIEVEKYIDIAKSLLTLNGYIYIEVPGIFNAKNLYNYRLYSYWQMAHIYTFSLDTLINCMSKSNLKLVAGNECVRALFKVDNDKNSNKFTNKYHDIKEYIENIQENSSKLIFDRKNEIMRDLKQYIEENCYKKNIYIYGIGEHTKFLLDNLDIKEHINGLINNVKIEQEYKYGLKIYEIDEVLENVDVIIISSESYEDEIYSRIKFLKTKGIEIKRLYDRWKND